MTYVNLGTYQFTTGLDYTGLNNNNLTSVLDLNSINIPYFEMYRLMINLSTIPDTVAQPSIVQQSPIASGSSLTTLNVTMPKAVTKGNCVVLGYSNWATTTNPLITGITIGASADNWGSLQFVNNTGGSSGGYTNLWADPNCQQTSTAIVVTTAGGAGTVVEYAQAFEVQNLLSTSSVATLADAAGFIGGAGTSFTTTAGNTSQPNDMNWASSLIAATGSVTITTPPQWTGDAVTGTNVPAVGDFPAAIFESTGAGPAGSSARYTLTTNTSVRGAVCSCALLPSTTPVSAQAFPFTLLVNNKQWDNQTTVAGQGYTYNIGDSPLQLTSGQSLQILWTSLPYVAYSGYVPYFNITAWFRYDPAVAGATAASTSMS